MNRFDPLMQISPPSVVAAVSMSVTAEPYLGSVSAMAAVRSPAAMLGKYLACAEVLSLIMITEGPVQVVANRMSPAIHDFIERQACSTARANSMALCPRPPNSSGIV